MLRYLLAAATEQLHAMGWQSATSLFSQGPCRPPQQRGSALNLAASGLKVCLARSV